MDDAHLNTSRLQPPRKPETVAPGLESKRNPFDHLAGLDRLVMPALYPSQQHIRIRPKLLQGLAVNAGSHSSHKPTRRAHFNDNYQSGVLIKGDERAAQIINLGHGEPPSLSPSDDDARPRRSPHSFSFKRSLQRQPFWHGSSLSQMPCGRRPHHQTKFFRA